MVKKGFSLAEGMTNKKPPNLANMQLSNKLTKNVTLLMNKSGLSQSKTASLAKIPLATLNAILLGVTTSPNLHTLAAIARALGVPIAQLIGELPLDFSGTTIPVLNWSD